jgi:hypothetical protein
MELRIGDLVQCRDTHYTRGLGIVGRIGMVAELRKKDLRILFDADNQSIWLTKPSVNRITLPPTDAPALLDRLTWVLHFVSGRECELERDEQGRYRYTVVCGELTLQEVLTIRDYMRPLLVELRLQPRGMSRLGVHLVFRPDAGAP